jgi:hypothetical protein
MHRKLKCNLRGGEFVAKADQYFACVDNSGKALGVWHFDGRVAVRVGVPYPSRSESSHVLVGSGEQLFEAVGKKLKGLLPDRAPFSFENMELQPGAYYPRMARVADQHAGNAHAVHYCPDHPNMKSELAIMRGQLASLTSKLIEICRTVHPSDDTFHVYGHEIRNLLILACTEVEVHWRGVLEANGQSGRFNTNTYVTLQRAMRLGEYGVALPYYPWLSMVRPFSGWDAAKPTESLPWYRAYNEVKHDREKSFASGTLINAINAVTACSVMLVAQFGEAEAFRAGHDLRSFFEIAERPNWKLSEAYCHPYDGFANGYEPVKYRF